MPHGGEAAATPRTSETNRDVTVRRATIRRITTILRRQREPPRTRGPRLAENGYVTRRATNDAVIIPSDGGAYCPAGGFHVDPAGAVERAVITHAHADHARPGSASYLCTETGAGL